MYIVQQKFVKLYADIVLHSILLLVIQVAAISQLVLLVELLLLCVCAQLLQLLYLPTQLQQKNPSIYNLLVYLFLFNLLNFVSSVSRKDKPAPSNDYEVITRGASAVPTAESAPIVSTYEVPNERPASAHGSDHKQETLTANRLYSTMESENTEQLQRNLAYESVF